MILYFLVFFGFKSNQVINDGIFTQLSNFDYSNNIPQINIIYMKPEYDLNDYKHKSTFDT